MEHRNYIDPPPQIHQKDLKLDILKIENAKTTRSTRRSKHVLEVSEKCHRDAFAGQRECVGQNNIIIRKCIHESPRDISWTHNSECIEENWKEVQAPF